MRHVALYYWNTFMIKKMRHAVPRYQNAFIIKCIYIYSCFRQFHLIS